MIVKKVIILLVVLLFFSGIIGCHRRVPPPHDAKSIKESEMNMDTDAKKKHQAAGGGSQLKESQW